MTTPEFPGGGSQHVSPSQQSLPVNYDQGAPSQMLPPEQTKSKKQSNVVGLIALITAVIGFIFACIPGALIVGWVLLPIAFVMGLVSLFLKDKSKWMGVTALILSIIGTIVGFVVFFSVVSSSFDEALGSGETTVVEPSDGADGTGEKAPKEDAAGQSGTRANPYSVGSAIENDEWRIVVNSVTLAATDVVLAANQFNEPPAEGSEYILVNYSATYLGDDANGQMPAFVSLEYVTADGTTVNSFDNYASVSEPFDSTSTLYTNGTATGNVAFEVPTATAGQGVLAVRPSVIGDKVFIAVQ